MARIKSENVGSGEVLDKMDKVRIKRGIVNPNTLATAWIFLLDNITVQGLAFVSQASAFTGPILMSIFDRSASLPLRITQCEF